MSDELGEQPQSRLSRWSQRKQLAREQDQLLSEQPAATEITEPEADEEPLLCDEDMPALDTIDANSDLSCFFNKGVSEKLRQAALRQLFRCPALNITDGLNDYDEDYTSFEPLGDIITSDMRYHAARREKLEQEKLALQEESPVAEQTDSANAAEEEAEDVDQITAQDGSANSNENSLSADAAGEQPEHSAADEVEQAIRSADKDDAAAAQSIEET